MKDMGTGKLSCREGKTDSFVQEKYRTPHNNNNSKNYILESGLNAKEIEMTTTAESLELRFRLYLFYLVTHTEVMRDYLIHGLVDMFGSVTTCWYDNIIKWRPKSSLYQGIDFVILCAPNLINLTK